MLGSAPVKQGQIFSETGIGINIPAGPTKDSFGREVQFLCYDKAAKQMIVSTADDNPRLGIMICRLLFFI